MESLRMMGWGLMVVGSSSVAAAAAVVAPGGGAGRGQLLEGQTVF